MKKKKKKDSDYKIYDQLTVILINKFREILFERDAALFGSIIAYNKPPTVQDVEFMGQVMTMQMLRLCGVELDSNFKDLNAARKEYDQFFEAMDKLQAALKPEIQNTKLDDVIKNAMKNGTKFKA